MQSQAVRCDHCLNRGSIGVNRGRNNAPLNLFLSCSTSLFSLSFSPVFFFSKLANRSRVSVIGRTNYAFVRHHTRIIITKPGVMELLYYRVCSPSSSQLDCDAVHTGSMSMIISRQLSRPKWAYLHHFK